MCAAIALSATGPRQSKSYPDTSVHIGRMNSSTAPVPTVEDLSAAGVPAARAKAWLSRLEELEGFMAAHGGRYPRALLGGRYESNLYYWLAYQRTTQVAEPLLRILNERIPGWDTPRRRESIPFPEGVKAVKAYREAQGTWPSCRSRDEDVFFLATWLKNQRIAVRSGNMQAAKKELFDSEVPGWNETVQETWERIAREIAAFRTKNGRMPSGVSKDNTERRLSRWLDDMRRGRGLSPERKAYLDEVVPGWDVTRFSKTSDTSAPAGDRTA